jgi:NADH-quinone oxidoreductase subunit M
MVLLGAFQVNVTLTAVAALGLIIAAVYSLWLMQRAFQGTPNPDVRSMPDFGAREMSVMIVMMVALVWLGCYPHPVLDLSAPVVEQVRGLVEAAS